MSKIRLDSLVVERGLCDSKNKAQAFIYAGQVWVDGQVVNKAGLQVKPDCELEFKAPSCLFVSRGGLKLQAALEDFKINPNGLVCADVGASTGGFTDCLLQRGARLVYAIDSGYGQLAVSLRQDERVVNLERTNVRYLAELPEPVDLVVIDVSFISLRLVLPVVRTWLKPGGRIIALFKPQFEVGKKIADRYKGVIKDEQIQIAALKDFEDYLGQHDFRLLGQIKSPVKGAKKGNQEYLLLLHLS